MVNPFQSVLYLQIRRRWLGVRVLTWSGGDFVWEGTPEFVIAQNKKGKKVAISPEVARQSTEIVGRSFTAFSHPRTIMDSYEDTLLVVEQCIREAGYKKGKLLFLVHVLDHWEGGLSDIERRAIGHMCAEAGSVGTRWVDRPYQLSPPEILEAARAKLANPV